MTGLPGTCAQYKSLPLMYRLAIRLPTNGVQYLSTSNENNLVTRYIPVSNTRISLSLVQTHSTIQNLCNNSNNLYPVTDS